MVETTNCTRSDGIKLQIRPDKTRQCSTETTPAMFLEDLQPGIPQRVEREA